MSRLITSGFEGATVADGLSGGPGASLAVDRVRRGSQSLKLPAATVNGYAGYLFAGVHGRWYRQRGYFWVAPGTPAASGAILLGADSAGWSVVILRTTGLRLTYSGASGNADLVVLPPEQVPRDRWFMLEYGFRTSAGGVADFEVRVDGVTRLLQTGPWSTGTIADAYWGNWQNSAPGFDMWVDDAALNDDQGPAEDASWPGEVGGERLFLPVAGAELPVGLSSYLLVDGQNLRSALATGGLILPHATGGADLPHRTTGAAIEPHTDGRIMYHRTNGKER